MNKILASAVMLFMTGSAFGKSLTVKLGEVEDEQISIQWETIKKNFPSMCEMAVTQLDMTAPIKTVSKDGKIAIKAQTLRAQPCPTAIGPHRGRVTLQIGSKLPALTEGSYELIINNETYGTLEVGETVRLLESVTAESIEGVIETGIAAIGGETTGVILHTDDSKTIEVDLNGHRTDDDLNGARVKLTGEWKQRRGVEIPRRKVFVVKELEVLAN
jgi:hypothetical protein